MKLLRIFAAFSARARRKSVYVPLLGFVAGVGVGSAAVLLFSDNQSTMSPTSQAQSAQVAERADRAYTRAKARVARDLKDSNITQAQAAAILEKIETIKKEAASNEQTIEQAREARKTLRDWARKENISTKYFNGLF